MKRLLLFITLLMPLLAGAQAKIKSFRKMAEGLHMMYYDTSTDRGYVTKSTIVEFKDFIVLIEMPVSTDGAGTLHLKDHSAEGEEILVTLKKQFPNKPLKYVLSTHWHPHSISSVIPFISRGITVVTTAKNYKRISEYIDSATYKKYGKNIVFVTDAGFSIKDKTNSIVAYRLDKKDYPHMPTDDFVFYNLPKYNILHSSCMYQRLKGSMVKGKEMISVRVEDVDKFIDAHNLKPAYFITTDIWEDDASGMASGDTLAVINKGIGMTILEKEFIAMDESVLTNKTDSLIRYMMQNMIPNSILNSAVYTCMRNKDLKKALAIARLQALNNPSNPNSWDTFGEVYYFLGEKQMAKKYEAQSKRIDKDFTRGGEAGWAQDLKDHEVRWAEDNIK